MHTLFTAPCHWVLSVSIHDIDIESKRQYLSSQELERCARFRQQDDQRRYILAHALKRYCLSHFLKIPASQLQFSVGAKGKPYCTNDNSPAFNLSHAGDFVLLGLSTLGHVGVDVEVIDREVSAAIFPKVLSQKQQDKVRQSNKPDYDFICYWTQKEAISKALGLGLAIDFTTIECTGLEGEFDIYHSKQCLLVSTLQWDEGHMLSVASTVNRPLEVIKVSGWQSDLVLECDCNGSLEIQPSY